MAKVLEFPTVEVREWVIFEGYMREVFESHGLAADVRDRVTRSMRSTWEAVFKAIPHSDTFSIEFHDVPAAEQASILRQVSAGVKQALDGQAKRFTNTIVLERFAFEMNEAGVNLA